ncbi:hypothetical protein T484DRAFT_3631798 [Baffinella frigidus]|nr:hypothetical protein T484DRAFT_3631798 [Cryptophyta sp. CCMP2293]
MRPGTPMPVGDGPLSPDLKLPTNPQALQAMINQVVARRGVKGIDELRARGISMERIAVGTVQAGDCVAPLNHLAKLGLKINKMIFQEDGASAPEGQTFLIRACSEGNTAAVVALLSLGANVHQGSPKCGVLPLFQAASLGSVSVLQVLLDAGAEVNGIKSDTGNTALHIAAQNGHLMSAMLLLNRGANPQHLNFNGCSPLVTAAIRLRVSVSACLIAWAKPTKMSPRDADPYELMHQAELALRQEKREEEWESLKLLLAHDAKGAYARGGARIAQKCGGSSVCGGEEGQVARGASAQRCRAANTSNEWYPSPERGASPWIRSCWVQLLEGHRRLNAVTLGPKGSNGLVSLWTRFPTIEGDAYPPQVQFSGTCSSQGRVWIYGGSYFCSSDQERMVDEVWSCDVESREWTRHAIAPSKGPGERAQHTAVAHEGFMYTFGGIALRGNKLETGGTRLSRGRKCALRGGRSCQGRARNMWQSRTKGRCGSGGGSNRTKRPSQTSGRSTLRSKSGGTKRLPARRTSLFRGRTPLCGPPRGGSTYTAETRKTGPKPET